MELKDLNFSLPGSIITARNITEVIEELDDLDDFFLQVKLGKISKSQDLPRISVSLNELAQKNNLKLSEQNDRDKIKLILQTLRSKAVIVHISFAGEPSANFLLKLISWMRTNLNPYIILQIGLQPNIGAGFTLRTKNKFFDFSLKKRLEGESQILISQFREGIVQ